MHCLIMGRAESVLSRNRTYFFCSHVTPSLARLSDLDLDDHGQERPDRTSVDVKEAVFALSTTPPTDCATAMRILGFFVTCSSSGSTLTDSSTA